MGRFINPDAFTSTGQGIFGSNMYAYCSNNPANFQDSQGTMMIPTWAEGSAPVAFASPGSTYYNTRTGGNSGILARLFKRFVTNTDEQTTLDSKYLSFYKGVPVVKLPIGTDAFSLGIIFLGDDVGQRIDAIETVRHEYGHSVHYDLIGFSSYFVNVLTPSVVGYHLGGTQYQSNYYSYVYEYTAEVLGEVNRPNYTYSSTTEDLWGAYLFYTLIYP